MMVNFKLGNKCDKDKMINMTHDNMTNKKDLNSQRKSNPRPREHRSGSLFTDLRELMEGEVI